MAHIGYARVSNNAQDPRVQLDALAEAGCTQIFRDDVNGTTQDRPHLTAALARVQEGDVLVVWRLDRPGRSLSHLIGIVNELAARNVGFRSLVEAVDTTGLDNHAVLSVFSSLGRLERGLIKARTRPGLVAAITSGRPSGRKPVITDEKLRRTNVLLAEGLTVREIATLLEVSKTALYEALRNEGGKPAETSEDGKVKIQANGALAASRISDRGK